MQSISMSRDEGLLQHTVPLLYVFDLAQKGEGGGGGNKKTNKNKTSLGGLEPPTFRLTAERANRLRHRDTCAFLSIIRYMFSHVAGLGCFLKARPKFFFSLSKKESAKHT